MNPLELSLRNGLPADVEIEKLVLGAVIQNAPENLNVASEILTAADFSVASHRVIFAIIEKMAEDEEKIDRVTILRRLMAAEKVDEAGGMSYVSNLDDGLPTIYNLDSYCDTVHQKSLLRQAITTAHLGIARLCEPAASLDDLSAFKADIAGIADESRNRRGGFRHIAEIINNPDHGGVQAFLNPPPETSGVPWPWPGLNRMIGFMAPGQVICVSAGTGVGKTTLMTQAALYAASLGHCAAILTLEMSATEQAKKIISQHGEACLSDWLRGESSKQDRKKISAAARDIYTKPIYMDDRDDVTPAMLCASLDRMKQPPALVGIDYAQLMDSGIRDKGSSREQHVAHISRSLKKFAKRFNCAFIVLSQENDDGKTRESKSLEQDATFRVRLERKPGGVYRMSCPKARFAAFGHHIELRLDGETGLFTEAGMGME